jgi:DNA repair protein RecN (Recombination protein N)
VIERFYLKEYLSFEEVELEFDNGLIVFTGPSGSGKSILMNSILASFGFADAQATLSEATVSWSIDEELTGLSNEESNIFRQIKKDKVRYFINSQSTSKSTLKDICAKKLRHLSLKDYSDFDQDSLLGMIDSYGSNELLKSELIFYKEKFREYKRASKELQIIEDEQKKVTELKEFVAFEIKKIEDISPKIGEDEELFEIKKLLSKKEKIEEKISQAEAIFALEHTVSEALSVLDIDSSFFDDAMNELRSKFENSHEMFERLEDVNIEEVLDRIEALSSLKRRYGSIEEALIYKEEKKQELQKYENIDNTKDELALMVQKLFSEVQNSAKKITQERAKIRPFCEKALNTYLKELYMREIRLELKSSELNANGENEIALKLETTSLDKISAGEFNRLRLAVLALKSESMSEDGGVLMLDEIDANLSGEESMSVAKVLRKLSHKFQIFVISHQPQLTSMGDHHFLVYKDEKSYVKKLDSDQRVDEIARIISGEKITNEAKLFAKDLLKASLSV